MTDMYIIAGVKPVFVQNYAFKENWKSTAGVSSDGIICH